MGKVVYNQDGSYEGFQTLCETLEGSEGVWKKFYRQVKRYDRAKGEAALKPDGNALAVLLFGEKGTVVLRLYQENLHGPDTFVPGGLGYHWRRATSLADLTHGFTRRRCEYLEGLPCYFAGSQLEARGPVEAFINSGAEGFWFALEAYYRRLVSQEAEL